MDHGKVIAEGTKEQLIAIITNTKDFWIEVKSNEKIDINQIKEFNGVKSVKMEDNVLKINSEIEVNNLNTILQYLMNHHIEIRSLEEKAPNLEKVFLTLTGRNLRD
jgi:ABC-2 type transport system ATP-binding protein